jgi:hypothetical protein
MMSLRRTWTLLALAVGAAAPAFAAPTRVAERQAPAGLSADPGPRWFETSRGWILTDEVAKAEWAARSLDSAADTFERHFGVALSRGVIVETRFAGFVEALPAEQRVWTLPWTSAAFEQRGVSKPRRDGHHLDGTSSLQHELAHAFFLSAVIPNLRKNQYGGDAPDWLDEAAAMVAETVPVSEMRRNLFRKQVCAGGLVPLDGFLRGGHPVFAAPKMKEMLDGLRARKLDRPVMLEMTLSELGLDEKSVTNFYAQARAFYDYLVFRSGDERMIGRIARAIRDSGDPAAWQGSAWFRDEMQLGDVSLADDFARWARSDAAKLSDCGAKA